MSARPTEPDAATLEPAVQRLGRELLESVRAERSWWRRWADEDVILEQMMKREDLRVAALHFVDVLPTLTDDVSLARHVGEYFGPVDLPVPLPGVARWGLSHAHHRWAAHTLAPVVRGLVGRMARRFIAGDNLADAERALRRMWDAGMGFTLDMLGEAVVSEAEAETYLQQYLDLLDGLTPEAARWAENPLLETVNGRASPRVNLSVKLTSLYSQLDPADPDTAAEAIKARLRPLLRKARDQGAFVTIDMEQYQTKDIALRVFREVLSEPELADWPDAGIAMQAYLRETPDDLASLIEWAKQRGTPVTVRLVRGAYWDYETVIARQQNWPMPVWTEKRHTDACYEHCLRMMLEAHPHVEAAVATQNVRSLALAVSLAERTGLRPDQYELQMLYGMAEPLKRALVERGQRLRVYTPFGELIPGMAYLVRRLLENTASQSFLRLGVSEQTPAEQLLAPPPPLPDDRAPPEQAPSDAEPNAEEEAPIPPFANEPVRRFIHDPERRRFREAIEKMRGDPGGEHPLLIGGRPVETDGTLTSYCPAEPSRVVGVCASAGAAEADRAVRAAHEAFEAWRSTPARQRARILRRAAELMRARRDELAALETIEAAKPWREADADVTEAIDFVEYYARQAVRLAEEVNLDVPGETNRFFYEPRGPGAVIAPWNFPLAIPCGMSTAAIAAGNPVVLKPAPQTPVIIARFAGLLREAGLPDGVVNYLPGGDEAGEALVAHPGVHFIAFTGSKAAGCAINAEGAKVRDGQHHIKHVVTEMGGKNALIVDDDADPDDAALGAVASAFGYAGQKCSALSRLILVGGHDALVDRLVEATRSLRLGPATEPGVAVPPVIDAEAQQRIRAAIDEARPYATVAHETDVSRFSEGHYVGPTIFTDVPPDSALAQEEIFGPVLAVMRARDFDHALELANNTAYGLTGGVYSRSPARLAAARDRFRVGNLYFNRRISGSVVNRQPFGGRKMSGTDAKAGGPDYLLHFMEPRVVTENTIRRGFSPDQPH